MFYSQLLQKMLYSFTQTTINLVKLGKKLSLYQLGFECSGISELATDRSSLPRKEEVAP